MTKQITLVFRYDDYSNASALDHEIRLMEVFRRQGVCLAVAAVPLLPGGDGKLAPLSAEKTDALRDYVADGTIDIVLHGYSHENVVGEGKRPRSEFAGTDYETQLRKIADGRRLLEEPTGAPISTFVPPWNTYDDATLAALESAGFKAISADLTGPGPVGDSLRFLPATCGLCDCGDAVNRAVRSPGDCGLVLVLLHPTDFPANPSFFDDLEALIESLKANENVSLRSITEAAELSIADPRAFRAYAGFRGSVFCRLAPPRLRCPLVYKPGPAMDRAKRLCGLFVVGGSLLAAVAMGALSRWAEESAAVLLAAPSLACRLVGPVTIGLVALGVWSKMRRPWVAVISSAAFVGAVIGSWLGR